jgi:hypothetical protein
LHHTNRSTTQIRIPYFWVNQQFFTCPLHHHSTVFQYIGAVGDFQGLVGVLLDQEHGHAITTQLFDDLENLLNDDRRQAQRRFVDLTTLPLSTNGFFND